MSYFDHVRCHACKTQLDPESLAPGMTCPNCRTQLSLPDLFGLSAAFDEEDAPNVSLDDLVSAPAARPSPAAAKPAAKAAGKPARPVPTRPAAAPPAPASGAANALVHRPAADDEAPSDALRAMRALKKKR